MKVIFDYSWCTLKLRSCEASVIGFEEAQRPRLTAKAGDIFVPSATSGTLVRREFTLYPGPDPASRPGTQRLCHQVDRPNRRTQ